MSDDKSNRIADWTVSFALSIACVAGQVGLLQFGFAAWPLFYFGIVLQLVIFPFVIFAVLRGMR